MLNFQLQVYRLLTYYCLPFTVYRLLITDY